MRGLISFSEYLLEGSNKSTATAIEYTYFRQSLQNVNFPIDLFKMMRKKKTRRIFSKFQFYAYNFIEKHYPTQIMCFYTVCVIDSAPY